MTITELGASPDGLGYKVQFSQARELPSLLDKVSDNFAILRAQSRSSSTIRRASTYGMYIARAEQTRGRDIK